MAEKTYPIPENPVFNMDIRALLDSDPASASGTFNPLIERLIENLCALKLLLDSKVGVEAMQGTLTDINNSLSGINTVLVGKAAANHGHNAATAQAAGFMAAADKAKLDGITAKATANTASATVPKALGAATAGSEAGFSRGDHVHPKPSAADIGAAAASHSHSGYAAASHNHSKSQITDLPKRYLVATNKTTGARYTYNFPVSLNASKDYKVTVLLKITGLTNVNGYRSNDAILKPGNRAEVFLERLQEPSMYLGGTYVEFSATYTATVELDSNTISIYLSITYNSKVGYGNIEWSAIVEEI